MSGDPVRGFVPRLVRIDGTLFGSRDGNNPHQYVCGGAVAGRTLALAIRTRKWTARFGGVTLRTEARPRGICERDCNRKGCSMAKGQMRSNKEKKKPKAEKPKAAPAGKAAAPAKKK